MTNTQLKPCGQARLQSIAANLLCSFAALSVFAQTNEMATGESSDDAELDDLAKKLNNPVASLVSVPFQNNFDFGAGPNGNGFQYKLNFQPVAPFSLNDDWNLISRTIMPFIHQNDYIGTTTQSGLGDTTESLFLSPKNPGPGGLIWGVGPDFYLPTATESLLGVEKWGAGPTGVALIQDHGWTYGMLANHIWSFAGNENRQNINSTYLQPFLSYTTKMHTSFTINSESTYDWENEQWTVPLNFMVQQVLRLGKQPIAFQLGVRYYADKPANGPEWGLRFTITLLFPEKADHK
jgi:hypothetical protein